MAEIATVFVSPFLQVFFEKMASGDFVDFFRRRKLSDKLLKNLNTTFLTLNAVLEDAEELQVSKPVVKKWLDELKDAVYDAEHVLDVIATEALRSELDAQFQTTANKLSNCNETLLKELPTGMEKLVIGGFNALESYDGLPSALKTLVISDCEKLELSTHLDYSSLEKLCLENCDSLKSFPLHLFPKLYDIQIDECSNLESLTVPEHYEHDLVTLQIRISYCPNFVSFPKGGLRAPSLTSLDIEYCENLKSLPEKMHIHLRSLERLYIEDCREVESFPEGGLPSNLNSIVILGCEKLIASRMGWGLQNLPILEHFLIAGKNEDLESFPEAQLLPTSLTYLLIYDFPNLKCLDKKGLQHLIALEKLHIRRCPKLKFMPEQGLPASLSILNIHDCPLLKKEWQSKKGKEWRKIAHVEQIWIDRQPIE